VGHVCTVSKRNGSVCLTVERYGCPLAEQCLQPKYRKRLPAEIFRQLRLSVSAEMEFYRRRAVHRENAATIISRATFREPRRSAAPVSSRCLCLAPATADVPVTLHVSAQHFVFLTLATFSFNPPFPFVYRQTSMPLFTKQRNW